MFIGFSSPSFFIRYSCSFILAKRCFSSRDRCCLVTDFGSASFGAGAKISSTCPKKVEVISSISNKEYGKKVGPNQSADSKYNMSFACGKNKSFIRICHMEHAENVYEKHGISFKAINQM